MKVGRRITFRVAPLGKVHFAHILGLSQGKYVLKSLTSFAPFQNRPPFGSRKRVVAREHRWRRSWRGAEHRDWRNRCAPHCPAPSYTSPFTTASTQSRSRLWESLSAPWSSRVTGDQSSPARCFALLHTVVKSMCSSEQYTVCTQNECGLHERSAVSPATGCFTSCWRFPLDPQVPGASPGSPAIPSHPQPSPARRPIPTVSRPFRVIFGRN